MTSLQRYVIPCLPMFAASTLWRATLGVAAVIAFVVARACGYDFATLARYTAYLTLHVVLPGTIFLYAVRRGPLSISHSIALGLPTGFALEIFTYLGLSAYHAKNLYPFIPYAWVAFALVIRWRRGEWPVRARISAHHAGLCLGWTVAFLCTALMAASQMFAESPMAAGLPTRAIFHDWVYLVSRAGVIKNNWPLDDPSLSGTPLQYHYFMMVHAAAASWTTGIEISAVMLRLIFVPLGAVLVTQAYVLGRAVSRNPWGGVIAALLTVVASELSFEPSYGDPMFLGLFVRWLFVSPTFFFGMIFCGALLIAVWECVRLRRCPPSRYAWLLLLAAAGTGAKGTVLPVMVAALGLWTAWRWLRERQLSARLVLIGASLTAAFAVVYVPTMFAWQTGDAAWHPFHIFELAGFWKQYLGPWQRWFAEWLPAWIATPVAKVLCAGVVFAGTCGVRLLAIPYLFWGDLKRRDSLLVGWIGSFMIVAGGMGMLLELNSHGELYVFLMMRLPMAVLTAAFFLAASRRVPDWWRAGAETPAASHARRAGANSFIAGAAPAIARTAVIASVGVLLFSLGVQTSLWWTRNRVGLKEWLKTPVDLKPDGYMQELQEALLWVRTHTEPDAVLVSNACTPENMKKDHWGALDRTLTGVHFYYSALSERRLWFEGPNYILDTTRARLRASMASNFFYRRRPLPPSSVSQGPSYILLDRSLADGAEVTLPVGNRVFANSRIEVYRLSDTSLGDGSQ